MEDKNEPQVIYSIGLDPVSKIGNRVFSICKITRTSDGKLVANTLDLSDEERQKIFENEVFLLAGYYHKADSDDSYVAAREYRNKIRDAYERAHDYSESVKIHQMLMIIDELLFNYEQRKGIDHCQRVYCLYSTYTSR